MTASAYAATIGAPLSRAKAAVILLHGRGTTAEGMMPLAEVFAQPDIAYLAPQAPAGSWYPYSFLAPIERNDPSPSQSLAVVGQLVEDLSEDGGTRSG